MSDLIWLHDAVNVADMADYTGLSVEDVKKVTDEVVKGLKALPTIDAVPVVHGHWEESNPKNSDTCRLIKCSKCGFSYIVGFNVPYEDWIEGRNYCVRCGAKMDAPTQSNDSNTLNALDVLGEKVTE